MPTALCVPRFLPGYSFSPVRFWGHYARSSRRLLAAQPHSGTRRSDRPMASRIGILAMSPLLIMTFTPGAGFRWGVRPLCVFTLPAPVTTQPGPPQTARTARYLNRHWRFQAPPVDIAILDPNDGPRIAPGCQHRVHDKARHAPVAVRVRMYIAEQQVPEHGANGRFGFSLQQIEQGRHGITHRFPARRYMPRPPQIHGIAAITRQSRSRDQASGNARLKQFTIPVPVSLADKRSGSTAANDHTDHCLEGLRLIHNRGS